jgi:hypothetical protein
MESLLSWANAHRRSGTFMECNSRDWAHLR